MLAIETLMSSPAFWSNTSAPIAPWPDLTWSMIFWAFAMKVFASLAPFLISAIVVTSSSYIFGSLISRPSVPSPLFTFAVISCRFAVVLLMFSRFSVTSWSIFLMMPGPSLPSPLSAPLRSPMAVSSFLPSSPIWVMTEFRSGVVFVVISAPSGRSVAASVPRLILR